VYTLNVEPHLVSQYVANGQLEITYHDFSFIGAESMSAAVAARCAGDQGQFWPYMEYLFSNQGTENGGTFSQTFFDRVADQLGLTRATFDQCLSDPSKTSAVQAETNQGKQLGIQGTPTLFVNGKQYTGGLDLSSVSAAIDTALQSAPASASPGTSPTLPATSPNAVPSAS
jgi:protein-disulfide isomerase